MGIWRWDQGRLQYFAFDSIKRIAKALADLDGTDLSNADLLRVPLESATNLPFSPTNYTVNRNYKRVFECMLLATDNHGSLAITDICRRIADDISSFDVDTYLALLIPRLCFPFPAFQGYDPTKEAVYPLSATLKYLLASYRTGGETSVSLEDVFSFIVGNNVKGVESVDSYLNLTPTSYLATGSESRQVREMLIFASQCSFLKWHNNRLFLDILPGDSESADAFATMIEPLKRVREADRALEILSSTAINGPVSMSSSTTVRRQNSDVVFTEGKRVRTTHLRTERSPYLRQALFSQKTLPYLCDMCECDPKYIYPWTDNILEVHHLLPLSSALNINSAGTSLDDVVAICPNCHRSVHTYYKLWLNDNGLDDFRTRDEVAQIYSDAKQAIQQ